jgi:hypothetical protein
MNACSAQFCDSPAVQRDTDNAAECIALILSRTMLAATVPTIQPNSTDLALQLDILLAVLRDAEPKLPLHLYVG